MIPVTQLSFVQVFVTVFRNQTRLSFRGKQELFNGLMFFVLVCMLFPLGVNPGAAFLSVSASGLIWVAVLLSLMLTVGAMFNADHEDGTIEEWVLSGAPLFLIVLAKVIAVWLVTVVPLVIMSPVLAIMLHMPLALLPVLVVSLLVGTLTLSLLISVGAALTAGVARGGILLMLLILPLSVPVLVFATGALQMVMDGGSPLGLIALLLSLMSLALVSCPFAAGAALRISIDN